MKLSDFEIGTEFEHLDARMRCVDLAESHVVAIPIGNVQVLIQHPIRGEIHSVIPYESAQEQGFFDFPYGVPVCALGLDEIGECRPIRPEPSQVADELPIDFFEMVFAWCDRIRNGRTLETIRDHLVKDEIPELEVELALRRAGQAPGPDGIVGESIDIILCAVDMIRTADPSVTPDQLRALAVKKCVKWFTNYGDRPGKDYTKTPATSEQGMTVSADYLNQGEPGFIRLSKTDLEAIKHAPDFGGGTQPHPDDLAKEAVPADDSEENPDKLEGLQRQIEFWQRFSTGPIKLGDLPKKISPEEAQRILDAFTASWPHVKELAEKISERVEIERKNTARVQSMMRTSEVTFIVHSDDEASDLSSRMAAEGYYLAATSTDTRDLPAAKIAAGGRQHRYRKVEDSAGDKQSFEQRNEHRARYISPERTEVAFVTFSSAELDDLKPRMAAAGFNHVSNSVTDETGKRVLVTGAVRATFRRREVSPKPRPAYEARNKNRVETLGPDVHEVAYVVETAEELADLRERMAPAGFGHISSTRRDFRGSWLPDGALCATFRRSDIGANSNV